MLSLKLWECQCTLEIFDFRLNVNFNTETTTLMPLSYCTLEAQADFNTRTITTLMYTADFRHKVQADVKSTIIQHDVLTQL